MSALDLIPSLAPVALLLFAGWCTRAFLLREEATWQGIDRLAFYLLLPVLFIDVILHTDFTRLPLGALGLALFCGLVAACLVLALLYVPLLRAGVSKASYSSVFQTATRWNAMVSLPVLATLYGQEGLALIAVAVLVLVPAINLVNVTLLLVLLSDERPKIGRLLWRLLTNPMIVGSLLGLALSLQPFALWGPADQALSNLAQAGGPILLLTLGAGIRLRGLLSAQLGLATLATALKMGLMPLVTLLMGRALGLEGQVLISAVLIAGTPTALNGYILARQMGGDAPLYANTASLQLLAALFLFPLWLSLV